MKTYKNSLMHYTNILNTDGGFMRFYRNVKEDPTAVFYIDGYLYRWGMHLTKNNDKKL